MSSFDRLFVEFTQQQGIVCSKEIKNNIIKYVEQLREYNSHTNILGTNDLEDILFKHILDSAIAYPYFISYSSNKNKKITDKKIADIGTGAGLPSIVLSILGLEHMYLVESKEKKAKFLKSVLHELKLPKAHLLHQNANEISMPMDIITCRAFSTIEKCLKLTKRMRTNKTEYIFYKGTRQIIEEELNDCTGFKLKKIVELKSPFIEGQRHLVIGTAR